MNGFVGGFDDFGFEEATEAGGYDAQDQAVAGHAQDLCRTVQVEVVRLQGLQEERALFGVTGELLRLSFQRPPLLLCRCGGGLWSLLAGPAHVSLLRSRAALLGRLHGLELATAEDAEPAPVPHATPAGVVPMRFSELPTQPKQLAVDSAQRSEAPFIDVDLPSLPPSPIFDSLNLPFDLAQFLIPRAPLSLGFLPEAERAASSAVVTQGISAGPSTIGRHPGWPGADGSDAEAYAAMAPSGATTSNHVGQRWRLRVA